MIQFTLKCANDHRFDSWFQSGVAFDKLHAAGMVSCSVCGSTTVDKAMMAPWVGTEDAPETPKKPSLSAPASPAEQALSELRKYVEKNSDYVGRNFASEARAIHTGDAPARPIWGETTAEERDALREEGVQALPLPAPFAPKPPKRKTDKPAN